MGMYTTIIHPLTGKPYQIKTGDDFCATYKVGSQIPWTPDRWRPGCHIDGVYEGLGPDTSTVLIVIKDATVMTVVDKADVVRWEDPYAALAQQYGITPPDASLWSEDAWERLREAEAKAKAEHDAWEKEAEALGYTGAQRVGFLMGKVLHRQMNYSSIGRQLFQIQPLPDVVNVSPETMRRFFEGED